jgi:type IV pilus assembly protein PilM
MAKARMAWGIDVGQCALKAVKLVDYGDDGEVQVEAFEIIEHPQILSEPDVDRDAMIQQSLETFLARQDVSGAAVAISVPGQNSFTRFFRPPPVEAKELPRIIQFEAGQQIPFPIDEVIWRWQSFEDPDSPDPEAGIFAMKRSDVAEMLSHYELANLPVDLIQIAPLALYNFLLYDGQQAEGGATLLMDIGTDKTDLVVSDGSQVWTRTVQIGGNNFTEALAKSFKLSFDKAEKLKRTAATSKYARQVFQVMRPVFADLVQEIQRSVGYYLSLHRESQFVKLIGMGNGFRLPGLQKFLEQNLNIPVTRLDTFHRAKPSQDSMVPQFNEGILSFPTAYGLALQELREVTVATSLLPEEIARKRLWLKKIPWFAASLVVLVLAVACPAIRAFGDARALTNRRLMDETTDITNSLGAWRDSYNALKNAGKDELNEIDSFMKLSGYHSTVPDIQAFVGETIAHVTAGDAGQEGPTLQMLLAEYNATSDFEELGAIREQILAVPRDQRKMIYVQAIRCTFRGNLIRTGGLNLSAGGQSRRGYEVQLIATTPLSAPQAQRLIDTITRVSTEEIAKRYPSLDIRRDDFKREKVGPVGQNASNLYPDTDLSDEVRMPDPFLSTPGALEDMSDDTYFVISWLIGVKDDGLATVEAAANPVSDEMLEQTPTE